MTLRILPEVELESAEAAAWYDDHQAGLGNDFLIEVESAIRRIGSDPHQFATLESYTGRYDIRRCVLDRFPYLVIFTCRPDEILIIALTHVRRRPLHWLQRLTSK
jgi:hypothetical protein